MNTKNKNFSIPWFQPVFWGNEKSYVMDALDSSWISEGSYLEKFEHLLSDTLNTSEVITVSNGTTALFLALLAENIENGDEVIVPGFTFAAPINMTLVTGATPIFVDVNLETWCISPSEIEQAITPRTKAIIPVHLYGNICNMSAITAIAKKYNLIVIEDVAEAFLSKFQNKYAGTIGDYGCFSFQATKTITTGEGGAVAISNFDKAEKSRIIRNHGMSQDKRYWHNQIGHNFRLTNFQAAFGLAQLENIQKIILNKNRVYQAYRTRLQQVEGITFQKIETDVTPVIWAVAIRIDPHVFHCQRDELIQKLSEKGIETRPGFYPFHDMPLYQAKFLPNTDTISKTVISLPSYPGLSDAEIDKICTILLSLRG